MEISLILSSLIHWNPWTIQFVTELQTVAVFKLRIKETELKNMLVIIV
jgi:hypothetical protein